MTCETTAHFGDIPLDPAIKVEKWMGHDYPTIIYHHGNNERPFNHKAGAKNSFYTIFVKSKDQFQANLIVVRAPFHNCSLSQYQDRMAFLLYFMLMIAASVKLNELIIQEIKLHCQSPIITCGISLGGWVTNLHRSYYNSSSAYIPLLAGTYLGELFLQSSYKKLTGSNALEEPDTIRGFLNFNSDFEKVKEENVFPVLALYDRFIEYEIQKKSYEGYEIKSIEAGHVTGALSASVFRDRCIDVLNMISERG